MNILVAFNDGYVMPTKVMLKSLIKYNPHNIFIYVMYSSLSEKSIYSIKELEDGVNTHIVFIHIDDTFFADVPFAQRYSKEAYFRLFAHDYLDERIDRILWLDGDIIINKSLEQLYNQEFDDKIYIAVRSQKYGNSVKRKERLKMSPEAIYINSGVMLINLKRARNEIDSKGIKKYINENQTLLKSVDQDVFNGYLYSHIKVIISDYLYNYWISCISRHNRKQVYKSAYIIHYCSLQKPWKKGYFHYGFFLWWKNALIDNRENRKLFIRLLPDYIMSFCKKRIKRIAPILVTKQSKQKNK